MKAAIPLLFVTFASLAARADLQLGTYQGLDKNQAVCQVSVDAVYYENNAPHPLNERVTVQYEGATWNLAHIPVISEDEGRVRFDHNFFRQIVATITGAKALVLKIDHDAEPHAPTELVFMDDNYRNAAASVKSVCTGLKLKPAAK